MPEEVRENFVIQTPEHVAEAEAGMHTLASPGAGLGLSGSDTYGLTGEAKGQFRIVVGRFVHQRLAMVGLVHLRAAGHRFGAGRALLAVQLPRTSPTT